MSTAIQIQWDREESLPQRQARSLLLQLEQAIASCPTAFHGDSVHCPLKHSFGNGIYMREIFIPKGTVLTGKIHRHAHPNVLLKGVVEVFTENGGLEHYEAPMTMISQAGTKRAVLALEDTVWITFHNVGEERDLEKIESMVIAPDYEAYDRQQQQQEVLCPG
jgi:hypothetical protein